MQINSFQENLMNSDYLKVLEELVGISSQSKDSVGVNKVQDYLENRLKKLGLKTKRFQNEEGRSGELLIAELEGETPFINLICHADTVLPVMENHNFRLSEDGKKALGPGIADNKGGIVVLLNALEKYLNSSQKKLSLRVVVSPNEELGSNGFHHLFKKFGESSLFSFGFEPSLENGDIIHSRNGNLWFELSVKGESYHSGRAPKGHMNAAFDLSRILSFLDEKAYEREDITLNVGSLDGGHSFNTITPDAIAKVDARFTNFEGLRFVKELFDKNWDDLLRPCSLNNKKSHVSLTVADFCPPLSKNEKSQNLIEFYNQAYTNITGTSISSVHCGGAADINHFCHEKLFALDGMGPVGGNMHRLDEWIEVESIESKAECFNKLLHYLEKTKINYESH